MQRRTLLKSTASLFFAASAGAVPGFLSRAAFAAAPADSRKVLVVLFQRFGMDGLMAVQPYGDASLAKLRPQLVLPAPGSGRDGQLLDLDSRFGLHPAFTALAPLFRAGELAVVHGAGSPHNTRSHSEAQLWWESGAPGNRQVRDGWLNRAIAGMPSDARSPLHSVAMTGTRPRILYGEQAVVSSAGLETLALDLGSDSAALAALEAAYRSSSHELLRDAGDSFDAARRLGELARREDPAALGYPADSVFGQSLSDIARLIKADVGLRVAFADSASLPANRGSWDSHSNQAALDGPFSNIARDFSQSLAAFWQELGERRDDVIVVTHTDFGRNVVQNEGIGTDHGRATAMFVLGGAVRGGTVYGSLPERFEREALEDGMDLPVTTDYRAVLSALTAAQLGITDHATVFPQWDGESMGSLLHTA